MHQSKSTRYYLDDGNIIFKVEGELFKVHRYFFTRESAVFRDMLSLPVAVNTIEEGTSDETPIVLEQVSSKSFRQLLSVFYEYTHNSLYELTYSRDEDHWLGILDLAHKWQFDLIHKLAVKMLGCMPIDAVPKILLCQRYSIELDWAMDAFILLCTRESSLSVDEGEKLGATLAVLIAQVREILREASTEALVHVELGPLLSKQRKVKAATIVIQKIIISRQACSAQLIGDLLDRPADQAVVSAPNSAPLPTSDVTEANQSDQAVQLSDDTSPKRHPHYYLDDGNVIFLVDGVLFRVHRYFFLQTPSIFHKIIPRTVPRGAVENEDEKPIVIPHVKNHEFAHFLRVLYNPTYDLSTVSTDQWLFILDLTSKWKFSEMHYLAVSALYGAKAIPDPVEKVRLWKKYRISNYWIMDAFTAICKREEPLSLQEGSIVGVDCAVLIAQAREKIRKNCQWESVSGLSAETVEELILLPSLWSDEHGLKS